MTNPSKIKSSASLSEGGEIKSGDVTVTSYSERSNTLEKNTVVDLTGRVLNERYRVGARMGTGGMGQVYEAEQLVLGRKVAIKVISPNMRHDTAAVQYFFAEGKTVAALGHENIVDIYDFGITEDGLAYMVMERLSGQSIDKILCESGKLPWPLVRHVMLELLAALSAVHAKGIIHRDIKPGNCFCLEGDGQSEFPRVKLLDFGIAKLLSDSVPEVPGVVGSPSYVSPEQGRGQQVDARSDLYSVGVMLYELLTGTRPFQSNNVADMVQQHIKDKPPPLKQAAPGLVLPEGVEEMVLRSLEKSPALRFQSAREMAQEIAALPSAVGAPDEDKRAASSSRMSRRAVPAAALRDAEELHALLGKVRRFWLSGTPAKTSRDAALAPQRRTLEWDLVVRPWGSVLGEQSHATSESEKDAYDSFEKCERELLIIGSPGCGKTTALLQIAHALADRVDNMERGQPIPVLFSLATFDGRTHSLASWLVDELRSKYGVPAKLARRFLKSRRIIPLLDGLDECAVAARPSCVSAINRFRSDYTPRGLVVSCRENDYLALNSRLELWGALRLHELTTSQVESYFDGMGTAGASLRELLLKHDGLSAFARTPLILSILSAIFEDGRDGEAQPSQVEPMLESLYERYLATMLHARRKRADTTPSEMLAPLRRLAVNMTAHHQSIFLFHELQATWLQGAGTRLLYLLLSRLLVGVVYGLSVVLPFGLTPLKNAGFQSSVSFGFVLGGVLALATGVIYALDASLLLRAYGGGVDPLRTAARRHIRRVILGTLTAAAMTGLMFVAGGGAAAPINMGIQLGLFSPVLFCNWYGPHGKYSDIRIEEALQWSRNSFLRALPWALLMVAVVGAPTLLVEDVRAALSIGGAGAAVFLLLTSVRRSQRPTDTPHAGIALSLRIALLSGLGFTAVSTLPFAVSYSLPYAACVGLAFGTWVALVYGAFAVISHHTLRWVLQLDGQPEYRNALFFDAARSHMLLREMGGGYMFPHATFQQHMVDRPVR